MYGGDEVNALVIDIGTSSVKAGYAGEDTPKAVFPSVVGVVQRGDGPSSNGEAAENMEVDGASQRPESSKQAASKSGRELYVGMQALNYPRPHMEVVSPFKDGAFHDWELIQGLWEHAFRERLRVDPREHPLMVAEPTTNTRELREKLVETLFETHQPPALFLGKNAMLSTFAMGRQTSLVVDSGHDSTVVAAVHDGYVLNKSVVRTPGAGALLTRCMLASVEARGVTIVPRFAVKRVEKAPGQFEVQRLELPGITDSFREYHREQIAADMKETICRVSDTPFDPDENANIPTVTYELPDGNEIQIGPDRFKVPEVMFQPKLLATYPGMEVIKGYDGGEVQSVPAAVLDSVNRCDVDIRRELYSGVVYTGGSSLFVAARERLERQLSEAAPQAARVKVTAPANQLERRFSVWLGGSILASLGSFQQMWMSRAEYEEHGAALIHRKAP